MYEMNYQYQSAYNKMTEDERLMAYEAGQLFIDDYCEMYGPRHAIAKLLDEDYPEDLLEKMGFDREDIDAALEDDFDEDEDEGEDFDGEDDG